MRLSVIVPVYNMAAGDKLRHCMDSLLAQTTTGYEILAVDDASIDESPEILAEYAHRFPEKVRVFTLPINKRQGGAKNLGLKEARGEWIGFIDSDDWVSPEFYEKLLKKAEDTGADMVGCDYSLVDSYFLGKDDISRVDSESYADIPVKIGKAVQCNTPDQTGILDQEKHKKLIMRSGSMVVKIYKASVIREHGLDFPEGIFYEDNCAAPLWSLYFTHFERVEEPLYYYLQHESSTVHHITEEKCRDRMKAGELLFEECKKRGFLKEYGREIEYRFTELYYVNTLFSYMLGSRRPRISFVRQLRRGTVQRFPDFQKNPYYQQFTRQEEQEMIGLQAKSDVLFYYYYRFKWLVRRIRTYQKFRTNF